MTNARYVEVGTYGGTAVNVDMTYIGGGADLPAQSVTLNAQYVYANPMPPGYPTPPFLDGVAASNAFTPGKVIASGATIVVIAPEAAALIALGATPG